MPTGIIINSLSIILGGIAGGLFGDYLRDDFKENLNLIFGLASMVMGISAIMNMVNMPAVIFAVVIGTIIGLALKFGNLINKGAGLMEKGLSKITPSKQTGLAHDEFYAQLLTVIVLFCASGTGIYGSLESGMTGDASILISKSILDFFTAMIFSCSLGYIVSMIAIPQFIVFFLLFHIRQMPQYVHIEDNALRIKMNRNKLLYFPLYLSFAQIYIRPAETPYFINSTTIPEFLH